jgi:hypothetical protein
MPTTERPSAAGAEDVVARHRDVSIRAVLSFGFWLAVGLIASAAAMFVLLRALEKKERAEDRKLSPMIAASLARTPPEPRLEPYPLFPRQRLRAEEEGVLTTYGWVDKDRGVVRVPIDRAMDLLVQHGLPPAKPMPAAAPAPMAAAPPERAP